MTAVLVLAVLLLAPFGSSASLADDAAMKVESPLKSWMADFNSDKTEKVCDLFAADGRADYRGYSTRDHQAVCDLLTKSLADETCAYRYALDIKEILDDAAVLRLVCTLTIKEKDGREI